jgi:hypothetical protein
LRFGMLGMHVRDTSVSVKARGRPQGILVR